MDFATTGQLLIIYSAFTKYFRKNGNAKFTFTDFKKVMDHLGGRSYIILSLSLVSP